MSEPLHTGIVRRPRLEGRLDGESLPRLTVLTAGPGSGKTTLLAQCFDSRPAVWHTLTPADRSLSVLARNVVRKLRLVVPTLSSELLTAVEGARGPDPSSDSGRPMAIAAALAQDLDLALSRDVVLVLDDIHEIGNSTEAINFLASLCRHVPRHLRLITSSRASLPFPVSRLVVDGQLDQIAASDLAFTPGEIDELVRLRLGRSDKRLAEEITALTAGWPVTVVLAVEAAAHDGASIRRSVLDRSALFDYLAEEVLGTQSLEAISNLRDAALLPWIGEDLLSRLGVERADPMLAKSSVYMGSALDVPGALVVSPLVREYLLQRFPPSEPRRSSLLVTAADWYRENGFAIEALGCLQQSSNSTQVSTFLAGEGDAMLAAGYSRPIVDAIKALPADEVTADILLLDAEARQLLGDWEGAMERYRVLVPGEGQIPARLAWRLGFLSHMQGKIVDALATYERGELGTDDHRAEAALLGWHASAHWLRGERDQAKNLADRALELANQSDDLRSLATAHTVLALVAALDGDRATNDVHYLKALEYAERGRDVVQTIRIRSNRASAFLEEGEFDAALAELDIALRLADLTGFELWRGMALSNRAQVLAFKGRLEEAIADLTEARSAFRRIGSLLESYPVAHMGDVYRVRGDAARARAAYEEAIMLAEDQYDLQVLVPALSGLARLVASREPALAVELARRATEVDSVIGRVQALVAAGWAAHMADRAEEARSMAEQAAHVARIRHDLPGLGEALELGAAADPASSVALLEEAFEVWRHLDAPIAMARVDLARAKLAGGIEGAARAAKAGATLQLHGAAGLAREARDAADSMGRPHADRHLVIKTLGGFDVSIGGESVPRTAWQSRVAREVLWMLLSIRGRPLNREVLMDRLWPDEDPEKASNRLSVALSTIRKVLDPSGEHPADRYVISDRDAMQFRNENAAVDVEEFMDAAQTGLRLAAAGRREEGYAYLRVAEERYVGEFLEEEPYAEWAVTLREQARTEYLAVASRLAEEAAETGDHDGAARRYLRMLERDPYNEPAHLDLLRAMRRSGRHGTARRLYGNYVARMAELEIEPEPFPESPPSSTHS